MKTSFLRRLFGLEPARREPRSLAPADSPEPRSASLLKAATQAKEEKRYDDAVATLRQSFEEIAKEGGGHSISTYLRLPMMLQLAGRRDEAWSEYNRLLSSDVTGMGCDPEVGPMERSQIYDKMRLMLQREGKHRWALSMGVFSYVSSAIGLKRQQRIEELDQHIAAGAVSSMLNPLLKRAGMTAVHDELVVLVQNQLADLERVDFAALAKKIDTVVSREQGV